MTARGPKETRAARLERQLRANLGKRKTRARAEQERTANEAPAPGDMAESGAAADRPDEPGLPIPPFARNSSQDNA